MLYPVYVWPGDETHAHSAQVHDFPGCFCAADTYPPWFRKLLNVGALVKMSHFQHNTSWNSPE